MPRTRTHGPARRQSSSAPASAWSDIPALLMLGTGTLLYLALISYQPSDLPAWVPFSQYAARDVPRLNFIGPVGAVVAGLHFFFLRRGVVPRGGAAAGLRRR